MFGLMRVHVSPPELPLETGGIIGTNAVMPHDVPSGRGGRDVGVCAREEG